MLIDKSFFKKINKKKSNSNQKNKDQIEYEK